MAPAHYEDAYHFYPANKSNQTIIDIIGWVCLIVNFASPVINFRLTMKAEKIKEKNENYT